MTKNLGRSKGCKVGLLNKGPQAALKIRQSYLINENAVKGFHQQSPIEPGNNRDEVFIGDTAGVGHHRAHLANNRFQKLRASLKPGWLVALTGFLEAGSGPGIVFSSINHTVWQGAVL